MKNSIFLAGLLSLLIGCKQDVQPLDTASLATTVSAASRVTNGASIIGSTKINIATAPALSDSIKLTNWNPKGVSLTAVQLEIDKIIGTETIWKETAIKFSTTADLNQPFTIANIPAGNYKVELAVLNPDPMTVRTFNNVKVVENLDTNLGVIQL